MNDFARGDHGFLNIMSVGSLNVCIDFLQLM
jgi:hypothetical protein